MKKILSVIVLSLMTIGFVYGQNDADAIRNSQVTFGGTARGMGLAGATGALGADFSDLSNNPAGIGLYRANEFTFTPGLDFINTGTNYLGTNTNNVRSTDFNISNLGFVWTHHFNEKRVKGWKTINFALGANRLANFNSTVTYTGANYNNSLMNSFLEQLNANGGEPVANINNDYPFGAGLAYNANLITQTNGVYTSPLSTGGVQQSNTITTSGNITEYLFAMGANYNDRLYIGGTLGLPYINYYYNSTYTETNIGNSVPGGFENFAYANSLHTTGNGVNGKFGLIYRVNNFLRLGAAIHSPTYYYNMQDSYSSYLTSNLTSGSTTAYSPYGNYNYSLTTPWKFVGSAILVFQKYGFISADYEYVDYSQAYYTFNDVSSSNDIAIQNAQNNLISLKYGTTNDFKVGGELALDIFRIRAGYALYGSPFKSDYAVPGYTGQTQYITGGIGFREHNFFMDIGVVHMLNQSFQQPYTLAAGETPPGAGITTMSNDYVVTIGIRY